MTQAIDPSDFYDKLAPDYDLMTRFDERLDREQATLKGWVDRYGIRSALDTACGTGLHAIALARLGIEVAASDLSATMLRHAEANARRLNARVRFILSSIQRAHEVVSSPVDAVFCLGNSIPHLLDDSGLHTALGAFRSAVKPDGVAVIQLLNYDNILRQRERIIGIHKVSNLEFVRFYDFREDSVIFNVLTIDWSESPPVHRIASTELRAYKRDYLIAALRASGFSRIAESGDMNFTPYSESSSRDLVITAQR